MRKLLWKECKLSASALSYLFLAAAVLTFVPGYPILVGAFFITLGIFYSFQTTRENNDILYSLLLPIGKADVVTGKFLFSVLTELCGFALMTVFTLIRMLALRDAAVYTENALLCADLSFLGFVLLIFGLFNAIFIRGFFRTGYYFGKPFVIYGISAFAAVTVAETLYHVPGTQAWHPFGFDPFLPQFSVLCAGAAAYVLLTVLGWKRSVRAFARIDL